MKIKSFFAGLLSLAVMASCSTDDELNGGVNTPADTDAGVYMSVMVQMPNTRSFTTGDGGSNNGIEIGKPQENKVSTLLIVLAKTDDNAYVAHSFVDNNLNAFNNGQNYKATGKITKSTLASFYNANPANTDVNVFVFCNPTAQLLSIFNSGVVPANWIDATCSLAEGESVWSDNNFLMSNYSIAQRTLPRSLDDWNSFTTETSPFDLSGHNNPGSSVNDIDNSNANGRGAIKVERSVARFDFRDGSKDNEAYKALNLPANTYPVLRDINADGTAGDFIVNITLNKMALVNMNNKFHYLRRVSADGTAAARQICMPELPWYTDDNGKPVAGLSGNYVVDAYAAEKLAGITDGFSNYFNYPFFTDGGVSDNTEANNRWYTTRLNTLLQDGANDNPQDWNASNTYGSYKIWRYVTENTIPAPAANQTNGLTTGVVFKGKMVATEALINSDDEDLRTLADALTNKDGKLGNTNEDPILYQLGGSLYCTWPSIRKHALAISYNESTKEWNRTNTLYKAVFGEGGTGADFDPMTQQDENSANYLWNQWSNAGKPVGTLLARFKKAVTEAGITIYQSSQDPEDGWGYYCYYYYWNRHNDNQVPGEMGPMEFSVVRNNVYKLAVTKISQLGHPRISENDPDKPTPDTPDEKGDVYMTVQCDVLPWVVRLNNIEF